MALRGMAVTAGDSSWLSHGRGREEEREGGTRYFQKWHQLNEEGLTLLLTCYDETSRITHQAPLA